MRTNLRTISLSLVAVLSSAQVTFASTAVAPAASTTHEVKLGFVNVRAALVKCDEGVEALEKLKKQQQENQAKLDAKQKKVMDLKTALTNQSAVMKPEVKEAKLKELQEEAGEAQKMLMELQQEMQQSEQQMMEGIMSKMTPIVKHIGTSGKYTMIFQEAVIYAPPQADLTNEVIRRYNEAYSTKESPAKKQKT